MKVIIKFQILEMLKVAYVIKIEPMRVDINGGMKFDEYSFKKMAKGGSIPKFKINKWNFS